MNGTSIETSTAALGYIFVSNRFDEEKSAILGGNAARLFGMNG